MSNTLYKEIWINAGIEKVFASFTEQEAMLAWHGKEVETDPRPGGIYKVVFEDGTVILGSFQEVMPNQSVVYSAKYEDVESVVRIDFISENGGTRVKLQQEFSPEQDTSSFEGGWDYFMGLLKKVIEQ